MRNAVILLFVMTIAITALATDQDYSNELSANNTPSVIYEYRQGGPTIDDPTVINGLPFNDIGTTCGFTNDYDVACPNSGSTSPDVVYSFTPDSDMTVAVDLCGSVYDTKTYIYDANMTVIACNADYYFEQIPCGYHTSKIEAADLVGGGTYYIIIDGDGGECGEYQVKVSMVVECFVDCLFDAVAEGEPPLVDGYFDEHNGGCNSPEFGIPFQRIDWINDDDGTPPYDGSAWLCGVSGWYIDSRGVNNRDTDWFVATARETGLMEFTVESEYPCKIAQLNYQSCETLSGFQNAIVECGAPATLSIPVTAGEEIYLWVGPLTFSGPVREFNYFATLTNNVFGVVSVEEISWGGLKSMYR